MQGSIYSSEQAYFHVMNSIKCKQVNESKSSYSDQFDDKLHFNTLLGSSGSRRSEIEMSSPVSDSHFYSGDRQPNRLDHHETENRSSVNSGRKHCRNRLDSFQPSLGCRDETLRDTGSLSAQDTENLSARERLENSCQTQDFINEFVEDCCSLRSLSKGNVSRETQKDRAANENAKVRWKSPVIDVVEKPESRHTKLTPSSDYHYDFRKGLNSNCPEGMASQGFDTGSTLGKEYSSDLPSSTSAQEALSEIFDSFQSIPPSLVSSDPESMKVENSSNSQKHFQLLSDTDRLNGTKLVHGVQLSNTNRKIKDKPPSNVQNKDLKENSEEMPVRTPRYILSCRRYMLQASQGGSGKLVSEKGVESIQNKTVSCIQPSDVLQSSDGPGQFKQNYAAYLSCAPDDLPQFGMAFHSMLQGWGFKIFLPPRDFVLKSCDIDDLSTALEERCNGKIIVVLSVNYEASEECAFVTSLARELDFESRKRNIILVRIDKEVQVHTDLQGLTVIHYAQDYKHQCLKRNLIDAIAA
ncbi:uncharacterized protein LOC106068864 isoform X2 [Biomphalaria glabrata]|uniref:Uncharacterized protein LOC106068864 isoform X2 n=1 Tax=Biomphalaria glabrata TaxID=6526 RepID=A0A9W2YCH7_BIOGL|nr:uncharacterized protein LOC106068864 isoform X2 [Biomphalaria glabrata]